MGLAIPAPAVATVPVIGGDTFPVRRIYCVGRNYAEHAREMGARSRPRAAVLLHEAGRRHRADRQRPSPIPPKTKDYQHEIELVVALAKGGRQTCRWRRRSTSSSAMPSDST